MNYQKKKHTHPAFERGSNEKALKCEEKLKSGKKNLIYLTYGNDKRKSWKKKLIFLNLLWKKSKEIIYEKKSINRDMKKFKFRIEL